LRRSSEPRLDPVDAEYLLRLQRASFTYFLRETDPATGLVRDSTHVGSPASITAIGLALTAYVVACERGFMSRDEARARTLTTLRFLRNSPHGPQADAAGHRGFYYHFLSMNSGRRVWKCELSTIDTTYLIAGALCARAYFEGADSAEVEIRRIGEELYRRVDWAWATAGGRTIALGWTPERGFLPHRWRGYSEATLLYLLALGSPTHPIRPQGYAAATSSYEWRTLYGLEYVFAGPLFIHQLSHVFVDFRGIRDAYMRKRGIDYFENSRRATFAQQRYAMDNPHGFAGYGEFCWGITACEGPGPATLRIGGEKRRFFDYVARGIPDGPDDGTLAPWAVVASLPFAPEVVLPTIRSIDEMGVGKSGPYGFQATFNPTFPANTPDPCGWISPRNFGLNDGPIVLMIENFRSGLIWETFKKCPFLIRGLRRAGFRGGWLRKARAAS